MSSESRDWFFPILCGQWASGEGGGSSGPYFLLPAAGPPSPAWAAGPGGAGPVAGEPRAPGGQQVVSVLGAVPAGAAGGVGEQPPAVWSGQVPGLTLGLCRLHHRSSSRPSCGARGWGPHFARGAPEGCYTCTGKVTAQVRDSNSLRKVWTREPVGAFAPPRLCCWGAGGRVFRGRELSPGRGLGVGERVSR